jgi:hypothetical protein
MIASRKKAAVAFAGGATLALLAGCAQMPATYQALPMDDAAWAAQQQRNAAWDAQQQRAYAPPMDSAEVMARYRAYLEQQNARRYQYQPDDAPVTQAAPQRGRRHYNPRNDDGPVIAEPAPTPAPVPQTSNRPECVGWWRLCHFL